MVLTACSSTSSADQVVAIVNGSPIERSAFEDYAAVLTSPDGQRDESDAGILLSLVNQVFAHQEAVRRGIAVESSSIDEAVAAFEQLDVAQRAVERSGGVDALRARMRTFLEFNEVREEIVSVVEVTHEELRRAYYRGPALSGLPFDQAAPRLLEHLRAEAAERYWASWLESQRLCAYILVLDASIGVPTSTPQPSCA